MAQRIRFLDSISSFSSIALNEYEEYFWHEIWGCTKIIGIPYSDVWKMPVLERKTLILRHNKMQEEAENGGPNNVPQNMSGAEINNFVAGNMGMM